MLSANGTALITIGGCMCGPSCAPPSLHAVRKQRAAPSALCATIPSVFIFRFSHKRHAKHKISRRGGIKHREVRLLPSYTKRFDNWRDDYEESVFIPDWSGCGGSAA